MRVHTIKQTFSRPSGWIAFFIGVAAMGILFSLFTDHALTVGNFGRVYAYTNLSLQLLIVLLFGVDLALLWNKHFSSSMAGAGIGGGFLAALVAGCPACSISLASVLGLGGVISAIPNAGMLLKVVGIALLLYSIYALSDPTCKLKPRKT